MAVLIDKALIRAGRRVADEVEPKVRARFRQVYGAEGDAHFDALVARLAANIASDSADPNESAPQRSRYSRKNSGPAKTL